MSTPEFTMQEATIPIGTAAQRRMVTRAVVASAVGTTIEWYDFFLLSGRRRARLPPSLFSRFGSVLRHPGGVFHELSGIRVAPARRRDLRPLR